MEKVNFYTHIEEDVENGETMYVEIYIDVKSHKLYLRSTVAGEWLDEKEAVKLIFGDREVSEKELKAWKDKKIKKYNYRVSHNIFKAPLAKNQAEEDNLWK